MKRIEQNMTDQELFKSLLVLDDIVCKAVKRESQVYMAWEDRLSRVFINSYHKLGKRVIDKTIALLNKKNQYTPATVKQIDNIASREFAQWSAEPKLYSSIYDATEESYSKSLQMGIERVLGFRDELPIHTIDPDRTIGEPVSKQDSLEVYIQKAAEKVALTGMTVVDQQAVDALTDQQAFWLGEFYPGEMQKGLKANAREILIESGLDKQDAAREFKTFLRGQFGFIPEIPEGWKGHPDDYFRNLSGNVVTVARAHGTMRSFERLGVTTYTIVNPEDEATCEICMKMTEQVFQVSSAIQRMNQQIQAKTKEEVKDIHPWLAWKDVKALTPQELMDKGFAYPPFHYACRCHPDVSEDFQIDPEAIPIEGDRPGRIGAPKMEDLSSVNPGITKGHYEKQHFMDKQGNTWMFKPGKERFVEVAAGQLADAIGHPSAEIHNYKVKGRKGSLQLLYKHISKDNTMSQVKAKSRYPWTKKQTKQLQKEHVWDFFLLNRDTHFENAMVKRGQLLFIDKGLSYGATANQLYSLERWNDLLSPNNVPKSVWSKSGIPNSKGKLSKFSEVEGLVKKIEAFPDDQYLAIMKPYIDSKPEPQRERTANFLLNHKKTFGKRVKAFYEEKERK